VLDIVLVFEVLLGLYAKTSWKTRHLTEGMLPQGQAIMWQCEDPQADSSSAHSVFSEL
jgi:hypothetical protein